MKLKRNYAKLYREHHATYEKHFSGKVSQAQIREIRKLVEWSKPDRLLDYGSGKGYQYLEKRIHDQWGGLLPYCYDPGVLQIGNKPDGTFGGVICTDVMEHIDPDDVDMILADIFGSLHQTGPVFAYFHISTRLAGKVFDNGENVHLTVQPSSWWDVKLNRFETRADLIIRATYAD
jgi:hypothetical protein